MNIDAGKAGELVGRILLVLTALAFAFMAAAFLLGLGSEPDERFRQGPADTDFCVKVPDECIDEEPDPRGAPFP